MPAGLENLKNNLKCELLLNLITEGIDIQPSSYMQTKELYFDVMDD